MDIIVNTRTGEMGDRSIWIHRFTELWSVGRARFPEFMSLLSPQIRLSAPGLRTTCGWEECERAFERTFAVLPDLTAFIHRWSACDDALFVEMTFSATIGRKPVRWRNVDRFLFRDGMAIERVAFFNPTPVRRALLAPSGWRQLWRHIRTGP